MGHELTYALITPHSLVKSRTGGILARLLQRTELRLVGAQMLAPTAEFALRYGDIVEQTTMGASPRAARLLGEYVRREFMPHSGLHQRALFLLFSGEDAWARLTAQAGHLRHGSKSGETVRDTYGEYVVNHDGSVRYFEPAILVPPTLESTALHLAYLGEFSASQPNIIAVPFVNQPACADRTLVIIKPDNWRFPSLRPGNIIEMLSRAGLRIVGCKIHQMSVAEALRFYEPVRGALRAKLSPVIGAKARELLESHFNLILSDDDEAALTATVGQNFAADQFSQIVRFMAGRRPEDCPPAEMERPGTETCMILIYQGEDCVSKIRSLLGPTDPGKAPSGTVRKEFGTDVMVNTAHASDSLESAAREMEIVRIGHNCVPEIIAEALATPSA